MIKVFNALELELALITVNIFLSLVSFVTYSNDQQVYAQSTDDNSLSFTNPINLTNNTRDSVYGQIASDEHNLYMVWQENNPDLLDYNHNDNNSKYTNNNYRNYDIYIRKSIDGGLTFSKQINLSNNSGFSEHPQIAISENNVYVVLVDDTLTNKKDILFRRSIDGGNTFEKVINLSNSSNADAYNQEIAAVGNNVYVVWQNSIIGNKPTANYPNGSSSISDHNDNYKSSITEKKNSSILFRASVDGGNSFKKIKTLSNNAFESYPKIAAFGNSAYVVWNVGIIGNLSNQSNNINNITNGIFFTKSVDNGNKFSDTIRLNDDWNSIGESQIAAYGNNVYVVWGGNPDYKIAGNMFIVKSSDNGIKFSKPMSLTGNKKNSLNVEVIADGDKNVYILWQSVLSNGNEEILFKKSSDNGATFTNPDKNISNNKGISECTSVVVSENNNVYVVWEDDTYGNHEILFSKNV